MMLNAINDLSKGYVEEVSNGRFQLKFIVCVAVMERAEEVKETSTLAHDLKWILHAYDTMIDSLIRNPRTSNKVLEIEELAGRLS